MKLFGRRKAASLAAAAPLALTIPRANQREMQVAEKLAGDSGGMIPFSLNRIPEPPTLRQYYASVENGRKALQFFGERRDLQRYGATLSPNIACLRSVSAQHKYIMHMREVDRIHEENRSFSERMMDLFGVRDYFKKMEERGNYPAEAQQSRY